MLKLWNRLFLEDRPTISLAFFRIFVALTTGFHVIPLFFHLQDNFFSTAIKELNGSFFPIDFLKFIQKSPDSLVVFFVVLFCVSWFFFLIGLWSWPSSIVMTACCYYFYALNSFQIGTLSWDILLVTLFLMCLTPYPGFYFSIDALYAKRQQTFKRRHPYFIQRLLQMQIAWTFFYTALYKVTAQGNWIHGNPIFYLMNYPEPGVVKHFLLKEFLAVHPQLCYAIGITVVTMEFLVGFFLFFPRTRIAGIYLGIFFQILLILTLDVPAIFFFLFPAQLLLFINSEDVLKWIKMKRVYNKQALRSKLIYDGHCGFCRESVRKLTEMDLFETLEFVDFQTHADLPSLHPELTKEKAKSQLYLVESVASPYGERMLYGGFFVFRRLCFTLPMLYPTILLVYFPGSGIIGPWIYRWVAEHRYLLRANKVASSLLTKEYTSSSLARLRDGPGRAQ